MKTLAEYLEEMATPAPDAAPELSGIECPECDGVLAWAEKSLVCKHPPMQRIVCPHCKFTQVVPVRE